MNLSVLWLTVWSRRRLFTLVFLSVLVLVVAITFLMTPVYLGEAFILVDTKSTDPLSGNAVPGELSVNILATQTDIITSRNVGLKVVDKMNLTKDPYYFEKFTNATKGQGSAREWLAEFVANTVTVVPSKDSNVLAIDFPARDPDLAAKLTNAVADAYIQASLELAADPASRQSAWFEQQKRELRQRVDVAQQQLADAQRKSTIVGTTSHIDVDNAKLTEVSTQLVTAQQTLYDSRTRLRQMNDALAKGELGTLPDILGNPLLQTLTTDLARAEASFADVSSRYDRAHPQYLSAAAAVKSLRDKLNNQIEAVRGSIEQTAQISQRQVAQLQTALDQQKQTVLDLQREHDALDILNHELDSAKAEYDTAMQRANQIRLASQLNQSTVAILSPAVAAFKPARPRPLLYLAIGIFFGATLAVAICLTTEIRDRRLRSRADLMEMTDLLVLAEIPRLPGRAKFA
jgi:polysaccharide biosynthesis transport protein